MALVLKPSSWLKKQQERNEAWKRAITEYPNAFKSYVMRQAIKLTSGTLTTEMLEAMGHPYSRRRRNPAVPVLPINKQTGRLQRSFRFMPTRHKTTFHLQATAPYAHEILSVSGTSLMVPRDFQKELIRRSFEEMKRLNQKMQRKRGEKQ